MAGEMPIAFARQSFLLVLTATPTARAGPNSAPSMETAPVSGTHGPEVAFTLRLVVYSVS